MGEERKQLVESLRRQQRQAWLAGERIAVERLLQPHPELQADADATLELIYNEVLLRQRSGEKPCQEEYQQRFPHLAERLELLFEVHFALDEQTWPAGFRPAVTAPEQSGTDSAPVLPVVPGYEIIRELGRGGIGVVYEAWQKSLNRRVALKMLVAGSCAGAEERARFRTEAEAAGRLNHVYIVPVHEVGESDGRPYLVMELIDGSNLAQHLSGTPWSPSPAADLVEKLARAIDYAHRQGIVHRDLKPANVLLQSAQDSARIDPIMEQPVGLSSSALVESTTPKITDFGLAKLLAGSAAARTQTGAFLGTPSYAAPEQAEGRSRDIGPAVDVYALGAILYEMLTGRPPFRGETWAETLLQVQFNEPVSPSRLRPNLPRDLTTICLKCLQKEPARRYATAAALAEDLQRFLAGIPITARPVGTLERTWRWCRRNPTVATLAGSVAALLVLMAVSATFGALRLRVDRDRANRAERTAKEELWRSLRDQAKALQSGQKAGQRFQSLKIIQEAIALARELRMPEDCFHELRNTAIASLVLPDVDMPKDWGGQPHDRDGFDFDGTDQIYARWDQQGAVSIRRMSDNVEIARWPGSGSAVWMRFSPDGRFLAVLVRDTPEITILKLDGEQAVVWMQEPANGLPFDFSPDSRQVAIGQKDGTIRVMDLASRQLLHQLKSHPLDVYAWLKFHPQRPLLAVAGSRSVQIYDVESEKVLAALPHPRVCHAVAWHPDGKMLATGCADRKLYLWDVPARMQTLVLEGHKTGGGISLAFNHAGDLLASNDWHGVLRFWDPRTGRQVFSTPALGGYPRFSSDDRLLAWETSGDRLRLLPVASGAGLRRLGSLPSGWDILGRAVISPDGRSLVAITTDSSSVGLVFADVATREELAFVPVDNIEAAVFEPNGALVTNGPSGLERWPVQMDDPASPGIRRLGPPQYLARLATAVGTGANKDCRVFAIPRRDQGALVVHLDHPERQVVLSPQQDVRFCAVSPNGRWVATGSHWGTAPTVKVWDADTGKLLKELPVEGSSMVGFSPDGRWLATTGGGCRLWAVGSWEEGPQVGGGPFAFSPDGKVLALQEGFGRVQLVDPNTGKEYARLEAPVQSRLYPQCFTPDGARLITWAQDHLALQIWDLRAIGQQLADIGLDWDLPYEPAKDTRPAPPLRVKWEVGNSFEFLPGGDRTSVGLDSLLLALNPFNLEAYLRRGRTYGRLATSQTAMGAPQRAKAASRRAIPEYGMALALMPAGHRDRGEALFRRSNNYRLLKDLPKAEADLQTLAERDLDLPPELHPAAAEQCHNLARRFVTDPEPQRQPNLALPLARKAVKFMPDQGKYWNTLGMVYYRLGQYAEAMEKLQHSLDLSKGERAAYNLFCLAMCHARQGDAAQAKACYDRARQWLQEHQDGRLSKEERAELTRLRAEADEILGLPPATTP